VAGAVGCRGREEVDGACRCRCCCCDRRRCCCCCRRCRLRRSPRAARLASLPAVRARAPRPKRRPARPGSTPSSARAASACRCLLGRHVTERSCCRAAAAAAASPLAVATERACWARLRLAFHPPRWPRSRRGASAELGEDSAREGCAAAAAAAAGAAPACGATPSPSGGSGTRDGRRNGTASRRTVALCGHGAVGGGGCAGPAGGTGGNVPPELTALILVHGPS
jgi:hypothetical protein